MVSPVYRTIWATDGYDGYYEGEPLTVNSSGLTLELIQLPDGVYQYGFKFIDIYGNNYYSQLVDITVGG